MCRPDLAQLHRAPADYQIEAAVERPVRDAQLDAVELGARQAPCGARHRTAGQLPSERQAALRRSAICTIGMYGLRGGAFGNSDASQMNRFS